MPYLSIQMIICVNRELHDCEPLPSVQQWDLAMHKKYNNLLKIISWHIWYFLLSYMINNTIYKICHQLFIILYYINGDKGEILIFDEL